MCDFTSVTPTRGFPNAANTDRRGMELLDPNLQAGGNYSFFPAKPFCLLLTETRPSAIFSSNQTLNFLLPRNRINWQDCFRQLRVPMIAAPWTGIHRNLADSNTRRHGRRLDHGYSNLSKAILQ